MIKILRTSRLLNRLVGRWVKMISDISPSEAQIVNQHLNILKTNLKRNLSKFLVVMADIDRIRISETSDTKQPVIKVEDSKGRYVTLTLDRNGEVQSISG